MKAVQLVKAFPAMFIFGWLGGCGTYVPAIGEIWDGPEGTKQIEFEIRKRVFCDLNTAVRVVRHLKVEIESPDGKITRKELLPDDWGAEVTIGLQVDEASGLSPGVALNTPMHAGITHFVGEGASGSAAVVSGLRYPFLSTPQSYSLGFGGTLSSTATRNDKINAYWSVAYLKQEPSKISMCQPGAEDPIGKNPSSSSPFLLVSDLGIEKWLEDSLTVHNLLPSTELGASASTPGGHSPDILQYEIRFVIVSNGNITPTWKLVRVSANTSNTPLFNISRSRSHDLTITIGPSKTAAGKITVAGKARKEQIAGAGLGPSERAANLHLATQIGLAVANSFRDLSQPSLPFLFP